MSWTKKQFILQAFSELGLGKYIFDSNPEKLEEALFSLDSMMATWNGNGIQLGYPLPSNPEDSDIDQETNVPDWANEAIYTNLAMRLSFGKRIVSNELKIAARQAYRVVLNKTSNIKPREYPDNLPVGAGYKSSSDGYRRFYSPKKDCCD